MKVFCTSWIVCLAAGYAAMAVAQGPKQEEFSLEGQIQAIAPNRMQVQSNANQMWMIAIPPNAKVSLVGTANADFLQSGMFIRFAGDFDRRGTAKEKIEKLVLFTPNADELCGAWPKTAEDAGGDTFGAGETPAETPKKTKPVKPAKPVKGGQDLGALTVAGKIMGNRNGVLTVNTGEAAFKIELAEDPTINVKVSDYSLARPGDTVVVKGKTVQGMQMGQATDVKITGAEPYSSGAAKGKTVKPKREPIKRTPATKKEPSAKKEPPAKKEPTTTKKPGKNGVFGDDVTNGFE